MHITKLIFCLLKSFEHGEMTKQISYPQKEKKKIPLLEAFNINFFFPADS